MSGTGLRARLRQRAGVLTAVREFFAARRVIEVATPALSRAAATDPALLSLGTTVESLGSHLYLLTSPEHAMKRLLAAGSGDIWQLARVFRDGELGRWHQPEFLLLEWYRTGFDEFALMDEVHALLQALCQAASIDLARLDLSYADAFGGEFGIDPHRLDAGSRTALAERLGADGIEVPGDLGPDALLDLALGTRIVPAWPRDTAVFLHGYPRTQAALAELRPGDPAVAARFEVFVNGIELGNGFRELRDPAEQRRRFEQDLASRRARGMPEVPMDTALLAALEDGLPACAGVALGFDRLLALLARAPELAAVIDWPHAREAD